ncbi:hypothetical protein HQ81_0105 [Dickeya phage phiDP23.1]|uniref:DUF7424 domain-containing protein n=17 Tax=Aglimvirinae TaxID=2169530 RepID=I0J302_9CAUD|nr:hypothetical protein G379_gp097 [Dickeya phage vB-DsoM-LIMEstone1]YP_009102932.1 hypothetical protein DA66_0092 [Dickeya phage RC-2014]AIM51340.1 hypothetical protein HQ80_0125 [Dickeya phage phiD3]AIM51690.1 hypothetical protein HQ82_0180 [Dickeya phage phiDP10.3]AIM51890.1 hypothetical protein HQ81_0105 [Dickeya phage phiDP23.1]ATW62130.1 hypothetical protein [Dickeya phage PP35]AYN55507.1 hypothetical protein [Dickeya phage Coodle]AYN55709.1 hypothetical protein [Dickeya phage Kamild]
MTLMRGINRMMLACAALLLVSCRIFVTPIISVSELWNPEVRTLPVTISADVQTCNKGILDGIVQEFQTFQKLIPLGCFEENTNTLKPYWETTIPLLRKGDEGKIPYLSASIYYSQNNSIIITFNPSFYAKLKQHTVGRLDVNSELTVTFKIVNDSAKPVRIATQGVFVNGEAVGNEMNIFEVKPEGTIWIRLSNVGVNSLLLDGIEPVGVLPARSR